MAFDFDETFKSIERQTQPQKEVFYPGASIYELILKLQCGWSMVLEEVKFMRFHDQGHDGPATRKRPTDPPITKGHLLPGYLDDLAKKWDVDFDVETFRSVSKPVVELRNLFAHMLYIESVEGEFPNREVAFWIVPFEDSVSFRSETWSQQRRQRHVVSEQQMRDSLADTRAILLECRRLEHRISFARELANPPWD
ncbi:hypothetical protein MX572_19295 [Rhodococcus pyridinivorans]|uniref:hypothetical protein n=1 Tax=Rhodococcus pyridinivorans TaxID=103816 RepID=UPI0020C72D1A|nr:hypothetical protein [Rhodococcus pyridinivorans]UTM36639.1 hypothetical protein MX572_19295 [Rhodococcus pyridinivorans]